MHVRNQATKVKGVPPIDPIVRLMRRTSVDDDGCWNWMGSVNNKGYGQIGIGSRTHSSRTMVLPHRLIYEHYFGKIPDNLELDHLCRNTLCVNPHHLETVTHQENCRRGDGGAHNAKKTHCKQGHEFTNENTRIGLDGRYCRTCNHVRSVQRWQQTKLGRQQ